MIEIFFENWIVQIIASIFVSLGFGIVCNVRNKNLLHTSIAGGLSWLVYLIGKKIGLTDGPVYFLATLSLALYSEVIAIVRKTPIITILIPAMIPLAPGGGIYYTMYNLIEKNYSLALEKGTSTFIIAGAMAVGVFTSANIVRIYEEKTKR